MAPQYEKMAEWVKNTLDPFVEQRILTITPPHAILVYAAAALPHNNTARRLFYAVTNHDARKPYRISSPELITSNDMVSILNDDELRAFTNLTSIILNEFRGQPSPLFAANKIATHESAGLEKHNKLLVSLFFGANNSYPWK